MDAFAVRGRYQRSRLGQELMWLSGSVSGGALRGEHVKSAGRVFSFAAPQLEAVMTLLMAAC